MDIKVHTTTEIEAVDPADPTGPSVVRTEIAYPSCERTMDKMFWMTLLPAIRSRNRVVRIAVPVLVNLVVGSATFSMLYYPNYYQTQGIVWTIDMAIVWIAYNLLLYLQTVWDRAGCFEHTEVSAVVKWISLSFYALYYIYWFYFAVIQFSTHNEPVVLIQLGNILMSTAWYIFFSTTAVVYYFICIKLSQRAESIREWILSFRMARYSNENFYLYYNVHNRRIANLGRYWNPILLLAVVLLTFHIPIDLVSILYNKYYYDILGLVIKTLSLVWYLVCICSLNEMEAYMISNMYKYRLYASEFIKEVETYAAYRRIGLDLYGLTLTRSRLLKVCLVVGNIFVPTLYAVLSSVWTGAGSASAAPQANVTAA